MTTRAAVTVTSAWANLEDGLTDDDRYWGQNVGGQTVYYVNAASAPGASTVGHVMPPAPHPDSKIILTADSSDPTWVRTDSPFTSQVVISDA